MSKVILPWFDPENQQDYRCLMWNLTRQCTANCPYCPFHYNHRSPYEHDAAKIISWIWEQFMKYPAKYTQVSLFGGEPTLHPRFMKIVQTLNELVQNVLVYTNLSDSVSFYFKTLGYARVSLITTYHENQMSPEMYIQKLRYLKEFATMPGYEDICKRIIVTVMTSDPSHQQVFETLRSEGFQVSLAEPHRGGQGHSHLKEDKTIIDTAGWKKVVNNNANCFTGWECLAGKNNLYIEENGDVFPCQCMGQRAFLQKEDATAPLTNIVSDPTFDWGNVPATTCTMKACRFELFLTKTEPVLGSGEDGNHS
jgi:Radical SAM superfamily.